MPFKVGLQNWTGVDCLTITEARRTIISLFLGTVFLKAQPNIPYHSVETYWAKSTTLFFFALFSQFSPSSILYLCTCYGESQIRTLSAAPLDAHYVQARDVDKIRNKHPISLSSSASHPPASTTYEHICRERELLSWKVTEICSLPLQNCWIEPSTWKIYCLWISDSFTHSSWLTECHLSLEHPSLHYWEVKTYIQPTAQTWLCFQQNNHASFSISTKCSSPLKILEC